MNNAALFRKARFPDEVAAGFGSLGRSPEGRGEKEGDTLQSDLSVALDARTDEPASLGKLFRRCCAVLCGPRYTSPTEGERLPSAREGPPTVETVLVTAA